MTAGWTAIVPMKQGGSPKSRLAEVLTLEQRRRLSALLSANVLGALKTAPEITRIVIVAPAPLGDGFDWSEDKGRGLNAELEAARVQAGADKTLFIHADLPLVQSEDIAALLIAAEQSGAAIGCDRHNEGTNALAITDVAPLALAFGEGSCAKHQKLLPNAIVVRRIGLSHDIDTPDDLRSARDAGWRPFL